MNIKKEIKKVLLINADGLKNLSKQIDKSFSHAIYELMKCKGKVVVTGIGKSGIIAQKIASTLSSTGTPSIYLHPTEALHGDVGVVQKEDIVIAIGKSGESEEILGIIPTLKEIGAKIIAITSNKDSSLSKQSSLVLFVPVLKEACPFNLAPTTSALLTLAVGDALAITLMKLRGFGIDRFSLYHPGGLIGKKLTLKVRDVMRSGKRNPSVQIGASMDALLVEISEKWTGAAAIVDKTNRFLGLVTDFDIREAFAKGKKISELSIAQIMNPSPITIKDDQLAIEALEIMESRKKALTVLPVINHRRQSVGMLHIHDLVARGLTQGFNQS